MIHNTTWDNLSSGPRVSCYRPLHTRVFFKPRSLHMSRCIHMSAHPCIIPISEIIRTPETPYELQSKLLKRGLYGGLYRGALGLINGDTRSLDNGSYVWQAVNIVVPFWVPSMLQPLVVGLIKQQRPSTLNAF